MGFDVSLMALPPECELFRLVEAGKLEATFLAFAPTYFLVRNRDGCHPDNYGGPIEEMKVLAHACELMVAEHPGIEHRFCELDRRFSQLEWLLAQCAEPVDKVFAKLAIQGEVAVFPGATGTQGIPTRWNASETCDIIDLWLQELDEELFRSKFDSDAMRYASLYKWSGGGEEELDYLVGYFHDLRTFYEAAVANGEGVMVVTD